jgi:hypothetical protein
MAVPAATADQGVAGAVFTQVASGLASLSERLSESFVHFFKGYASDCSEKIKASLIQSWSTCRNCCFISGLGRLSSGYPHTYPQAMWTLGAEGFSSTGYVDFVEMTLSIDHK